MIISRLESGEHLSVKKVMETFNISQSSASADLREAKSYRQGQKHKPERVHPPKIAEAS